MLNAQQKFKTTPVGDIPVDWECVRLGEIIDSLTSGASLVCGAEEPEANEPAILKLSCVSSGRFDPSERKKAPQEVWPHLKVSARKNSILISRSNTPALVGACAYVENDYPHLFLPDTIWRLEDNKENKSCQKWLSLLLGSGRFKNKLSQIASGTSNSMKKLQKPSLLRLKIPLPPLPEQQKIADILSTWDRAIETQQKLIAALTQRKKALAQQLLTGKTRLPGFEEPWKTVKLSEIFERVKKTAGDKTPRVLSITAGTGFVDQRTKFSRVIAGKNIAKYIQLERGDFSYNKGNSKRYQQGCVYQLHEFEDGVVPNVFYSFRNKGSADSNFYKHYFEAGRLNHQLSRVINSGVRNDGLLNLHANDFFKSRVQRPPLSEQTAIAKFLTTADRELALHTQNLTTLQTQKRALMQQLLTGKVRGTF